jgi:hypothetical protein
MLSLDVAIKSISLACIGLLRIASPYRSDRRPMVWKIYDKYAQYNTNEESTISVHNARCVYFLLFFFLDD